MIAPRRLPTSVDRPLPHQVRPVRREGCGGVACVVSARFLRRLTGTNQASRRGGTSLTEVLMSILVMGVGVLAVMTLFPISILRSIQATQLTNASILSKRADAIVEMFGLVTDTFIPQPLEGHVTNCIIDPLGWHDLVTLSASDANEFGNTGSGNPLRYPPDSRLGAPLFLGRIRDSNPTPLRRLSLAVGPINPGAAAYPALLSPIFGVPPSTAVRDDILAAVGLPDNFETAFIGEPDAAQTTPTKVGFPAATFDLSNLQTTPAPSRLVPGSRVTLFDVSGKRSQVRSTADGLAIALVGANWEIAWADPLPTNFGGISEIRVEFPESRYTWMLTVRKRGIAGGSVSEIDCVAFFNRPTGDSEEELVHVATQTPAGPGVPPSDIVAITYSAYASSPTKTPPIKKGAWLFDPQHSYWYRTIKVIAETDTTATVQLDRPAEDPINGVIVPEGVIHVFPLPSRVDQQRLDTARRAGRR